MTSSPFIRQDRPQPIFRDRREAGRALAELLQHYRGEPDVIVLGLAGGGVPVAAEVAAALGAALDTIVVRKLGAPGSPEFAIGALAADGRIVLNDDMVRALDLTAAQVRDIAHDEAQELARREAAYRMGRRPPDISGRTVIVVDDGLATGSSMFAAVDAISANGAARIVVAVPAAPESTCREFEAIVDEVVCASMPSPFFAVGDSFWNFTQVTDEEARELLDASGAWTPAEVLAPAEVVRAAAIPSPGGVPPDDVLDDLVGEARFVLIGESSHGTHEFYAARAAITRALIERKNFDAVAAEADWPDAYRVDRVVHESLSVCPRSRKYW